jgi:hypothetical protein
MESHPIERTRKDRHMNTTTVDETALQAFVLKAVDDLGAGYLGVMVSLGARLGLYRALA